MMSLLQSLLHSSVSIAARKMDNKPYVEPDSSSAGSIFMTMIAIALVGVLIWWWWTLITGALHS